MQAFRVRLVGTLLVLTGCLPAYNGASPNDAGDVDLAVSPSNTTGDTPDLAGTVLIDGFTSTGSLSIALDSTTSTLRLNESAIIHVSVDGNGETGTATLGLANAPAGVTATFDPATVTLGASAVPSVMTVTTASTMDPVSSVALEVEATVSGNVSTTTYGLTVLPKLVVHLGKGTGATTTASHFPPTISVKLYNGKMPVDFYNDDTIEHAVHADASSLGMKHEDGSLTANDGPVTNGGVATGASYYETTLTATGSATYYCHLHDTAPKSTIIVTQ